MTALLVLRTLGVMVPAALLVLLSGCGVIDSRSGDDPTLRVEAWNGVDWQNCTDAEPCDVVPGRTRMRLVVDASGMRFNGEAPRNAGTKLRWAGVNDVSAEQSLNAIPGRDGTFQQEYLAPGDAGLPHEVVVTLKGPTPGGSSVETSLDVPVRIERLAWRPCVIDTNSTSVVAGVDRARIAARLVDPTTPDVPIVLPGDSRPKLTLNGVTPTSTPTFLSADESGCYKTSFDVPSATTGTFRWTVDSTQAGGQATALSGEVAVAARLRWAVCEEFPQPWRAGQDVFAVRVGLVDSATGTRVILPNSSWKPSLGVQYPSSLTLRPPARIDPSGADGCFPITLPIPAEATDPLVLTVTGPSELGPTAPLELDLEIAGPELCLCGGASDMAPVGELCLEPAIASVCAAARPSTAAALRFALFARPHTSGSAATIRVVPRAGGTAFQSVGTLEPLPSDRSVQVLQVDIPLRELGPGASVHGQFAGRIASMLAPNTTAADIPLCAFVVPSLDAPSADPIVATISATAGDVTGCAALGFASTRGRIVASGEAAPWPGNSPLVYIVGPVGLGSTVSAEVVRAYPCPRDSDEGSGDHDDNSNACVPADVVDCSVRTVVAGTQYCSSRPSLGFADFGAGTVGARVEQNLSAASMWRIQLFGFGYREPLRFER